MLKLRATASAFYALEEARATTEDAAAAKELAVRFSKGFTDADLLQILRRLT